jgi:chromosome segregation ATPase
MSDQAEPKSLLGDTHPRADVLAEEYRGRYLSDELEKARERIANLEEQLAIAEQERDDFEASQTRLLEQLETLHRVVVGLTSGLKYLSREQIMEAAATSTAILDVPCSYVQDALRALDAYD